MRAGGVLFALLALATGASGMVPEPLGPCGAVDRRFAAIELVAGELGGLGRTPLARLGLVAFSGETPHAIPFQVDERRGRRLALPGGPEATDDDKPGVLDADDLVVFMACDAGARAGADVVARAFPGATAWREIRLEDPVATTTAFAYLVVADAPPTTARRYVAYDDTLDLVTAARYRIGLVGALPVYFAVALGGSLGPNLLDGLRLRAEATLLANLAHWDLDESKGRHQLIAWTAGPVRVVRRSRHQVTIGLGIRLTAGTAHTYFYPQHVFGPGKLHLPFSPGIFFRSITAFGGADGRDLRGWRYHAPGTPPGGLAIDGHMDDAERAFAASGDWFLAARDGAAVLFVLRLSENLARAVPLRLVYRDDAERPNPPELDPGTVPLMGFEGRHIEQLPGGKYGFEVSIFGLDHYHDGDEQRLLAELAAPVVVSVTRGPGVSAPTSHRRARHAPAPRVDHERAQLPESRGFRSKRVRAGAERSHLVLALIGLTQLQYGKSGSGYVPAKVREHVGRIDVGQMRADHDERRSRRHPPGARAARSAEECDQHEYPRAQHPRRSSRIARGRPTTPPSPTSPRRATRGSSRPGRCHGPTAPRSTISCCAS
jgi:hypothetical protein